MKKQCEPVITYKDIVFWERYFTGLKRDKQQKYGVKRILSTELNEEFAIAINPFGEAYPESNIRSRDIYEQIKFFIENGGVFVNTAGFAFFYSWDHANGERKAISEERLLLIEREAEKMKSMVEQIGFAGTYLYLDFESFVTSGSEDRVQTFQTKEDIEKFGKLGTPEIKEFRALRNETKNCIPILRAKSADFGEIYPIAAIKFGKGYLVIGGFIMETEAEARLFAEAVNAFCDWVSKESMPKQVEN